METSLVALHSSSSSSSSSSFGVLPLTLQSFPRALISASIMCKDAVDVAVLCLESKEVTVVSVLLASAFREA